MFDEATHYESQPIVQVTAAEKNSLWHDGLGDVADKFVAGLAHMEDDGQRAYVVVELLRAISDDRLDKIRAVTEAMESVAGIMKVRDLLTGVAQIHHERRLVPSSPADRKDGEP
jgi:hypothetical protein